MPWKILLTWAAFVMFVLAAFVAGGVLPLPGAGWLLPGGLAAYILSLLV